MHCRSYVCYKNCVSICNQSQVRKRLGVWCYPREKIIVWQDFLQVLQVPTYTKLVTSLQDLYSSCKYKILAKKMSLFLQVASNSCTRLFLNGAYLIHSFTDHSIKKLGTEDIIIWLSVSTKHDIKSWESLSQTLSDKLYESKSLYQSLGEYSIITANYCMLYPLWWVKEWQVCTHLPYPQSIWHHNL